MPPVCVLCGARAPGLDLCAACRSDLPFQDRACLRCALPLDTGEVCGRCLRQPPVFDGAVSVFNYAPPVDEMLQRLKFGRELIHARILGALMAEDLARRTVCLPQVVIPVPLHHRRLAGRGFNQALELARPIAARLGLPLDPYHCLRVRATGEQSRLGAGARRRNVQDAFRVRGGVVRDVALVDDVMTTGHTVAAMAQALRRAGARRIVVWVCARAAAPH